MMATPKTADNKSEKLRTSIYSKMSFVDKLEQVLRLREIAWSMKAAGLKSKNPELSDAEIQKQVRQIFLYAST